jgi:hypothetical protein
MRSGFERLKTIDVQFVNDLSGEARSNTRDSAKESFRIKDTSHPLQLSPLPGLDYLDNRSSQHAPDSWKRRESFESLILEDSPDIFSQAFNGICSLAIRSDPESIGALFVEQCCSFPKLLGNAFVVLQLHATGVANDGPFQLPGSNPTHIDMNELLFGVVANAAGL